MFFPLARLAGNKQLIENDTQLVVDGFPRSGNSFTEAAFLHSQAERGIVLKSHAHCPAQIIRAAELGVPAVLLIRDPDDVVASIIVAADVDRPEIHYRDYHAYYCALRGYEGTFVIATFDLVLSRFDHVVKAVNMRFGLHLSVPQLGDTFTYEVNAVRDGVSIAHTGRLANYEKRQPPAKNDAKAAEISHPHMDKPLALLRARQATYREYERLCALVSETEKCPLGTA